MELKSVVYLIPLSVAIGINLNENMIYQCCQVMYLPHAFVSCLELVRYITQVLRKEKTK